MNGRRMVVTVIAPDVSQNGVGRADMLARLLVRHFDVEIVGTAFGNGVWEPLRDGRFAIDAVRGRRGLAYAASWRAVLRLCRGDVLVAVKPLLPSFGVALRHRVLSGTPVVLDIDDDELAFRPRPSIWHLPRVASSILSPQGYIAARSMAAMIHKADAIVVASSGLQQRHGGTLIPHTKDTTCMCPRSDLRAATRQQLQIPLDRTVIMFAGTPRRHKGLDDAARAIALMRHSAVLAIVGAADDSGFAREFGASHPDVLMRPGPRIEDAHLPLHAADIIVIPQRECPESRVQLPAKIVEAMALAKPIVATNVSDLPLYLGDGRGWVVPPSDPVALARAFDAILDDPDGAAIAGQRARQWCLAHLSDDAVHERLAEVIDRVARRSARTREGTRQSTSQ
jgi:glycosyltransferase involved in cell wall biosynthesis